MVCSREERSMYIFFQTPKCKVKEGTGVVPICLSTGTHGSAPIHPPPDPATGRSEKDDPQCPPLMVMEGVWPAAAPVEEELGVVMGAGQVEGVHLSVSEAVMILPPLPLPHHPSPLLLLHQALVVHFTVTSPSQGVAQWSLTSVPHLLQHQIFPKANPQVKK